MKPEQRMASKRETRTGRPPVNKHEAEYWDTELHRFLLPKFRRVPGLVKGDRIDTAAVAQKGGVARFTVYRWFKNGLSPRGARVLIQISQTDKKPEGILSEDQIRPFIKI